MTYREWNLVCRFMVTVLQHIHEMRAYNGSRVASDKELMYQLQDTAKLSTWEAAHKRR